MVLKQRLKPQHTHIHVLVLEFHLTEPYPAACGLFPAVESPTCQFSLMAPNSIQFLSTLTFLVVRRPIVERGVQGQYRV